MAGTSWRCRRLYTGTEFGAIRPGDLFLELACGYRLAGQEISAVHLLGQAMDASAETTRAAVVVSWLAVELADRLAGAGMVQEERTRISEEAAVALGPAADVVNVELTIVDGAACRQWRIASRAGTRGQGRAYPAESGRAPRIPGSSLKGVLRSRAEYSGIHLPSAEARVLP
ncbi:MAG: hypothetical protein ACRDTF_10410 [Pseudonocardiaceae bacterium]